jgi:hypothetical protein
VAPRRFVAERGMKLCARHLRLRNRYRGDGTRIPAVGMRCRVGRRIGAGGLWEGCGFGGGHVVVRRLGGLEGRVMGVLQVRGDSNLCLESVGIEKAKIRMKRCRLTWNQGQRVRFGISSVSSIDSERNGHRVKGYRHVTRC